MKRIHKPGEDDQFRERGLRKLSEMPSLVAVQPINKEEEDMKCFKTSDAQESKSQQPIYIKPFAGVCVQLSPSIRRTPIQINITIPSDPTLASAVVTPNAETSAMNTVVTVRVEQFPRGRRQSAPNAALTSPSTLLETVLEEMENEPFSPHLFLSAPPSPSSGDEIMETSTRSPSPPKLVKEMLSFQRDFKNLDQEAPQLSKYLPQGPQDTKQMNIPEKGNDLGSCLKLNNMNIEDNITAKLSKVCQSMLDSLTADVNLPSSLSLVLEGKHDDPNSIPAQGIKRGRGRPKKVGAITRITPPQKKAGRGRPRKLRIEIPEEKVEPRPTSTYKRLLQHAEETHTPIPKKLVNKLETLKAICNKEDPDMGEIVLIMEETFKFRHKMINENLEINEAIFCFSPLLIPAYVVHEFGLLFEQNSEFEEEAFLGQVDKILYEYVRTGLATDHNNDDPSCLALQALKDDDSPEMRRIVGAILFINKKTNNKANQALYFTKIPIDHPQPCFKIKRNEKLWAKKLSANIYIEGRQIGCTASNFYEALMTVYYYYWIFNIKYLNYDRDIFKDFDYLIPSEVRNESLY